LVGLIAGVLALAAVLVATLVPTGPVLPTLHVREVLVRLQGAAGTSLTEMSRVSASFATELRGVPGVESAGAHVGRAITADEIVDVNAGEIWLTIAASADYEATMTSVREIAAGYPGLHTSVRTYAEDQVAAAQEKSGSKLVVRVYGPELATLRQTAENVSELLSTVTGVLSPTVEVPPSQPTVEIEVNLAAAQRHGLRPGDIRREASTLISGLVVGNLYQEQKVFDVLVWGGPATRHSISDLESLVIDTPSGGHVRLGEVATARIAPNPVSITHNSVSRSLDVTADVPDRSAADVAQEVTSRLRGLSLPYEYRAEVLSAAADREANHRTVAVIAVVVALLSFLILQSATGSWRLAAGLMVSVPVALAGGVLVAPLVGGVRSIGVLVALFALLALALRQALVFVRRARELEADDISPQQAVQQALRECAPVVVGGALITAAILAAPAVMGSTAGLELLHPFAVSMLAGLVTSIAVALIAVPACYLALDRRAEAPAAATPTSDIQAEVKL
jgi:Cu/Ag efflux pump CusA